MSVFFAAADCLYKIAHSWLDPVVNPVQTALGCPLRTEALAYPINGGLSVEMIYWPRFGGAFFMSGHLFAVRVRRRVE